MGRGRRRVCAIRPGGACEMRIKDVMTSPVVTVTPTTRLKQAAALLVRHGFNAVPVVDEGDLVGIVSEADLLGPESAPDPRANALRWPAPATRVPHLVGEVMTREELGDGGRRVEVADGVVTLSGFDPGRESELAALLARTVPGVVEVQVTATP